MLKVLNNLIIKLTLKPTHKYYTTSIDSNNKYIIEEIISQLIQNVESHIMCKLTNYTHYLTWG